MVAHNFKNQPAKMAGSQQAVSTPKGKVITLEDVNAIFESVDSGQPFQIHMMSDPDDDGRTKLQIRNCTDVSSDGIEHISKPYDSRALLKQLKSLDLTKEDVLEQLLTHSQPLALSELTAAHNNKSMIPLVTAKDGRVFSILAGRLAYSNWSGSYPMGFPQSPMRKLSDHALLPEKITPYQKDALVDIIKAVSNTEDSREFRKSVQLLRPKIWDDYKMMIAEPVDLESIYLKLWHGRYANMADFRRHVDLLQQNAETFNGDHSRFVTDAAVKVRSDIHRRMDETPASPSVDGEVQTQIRRIISVDEDGGGSAANFVTDAANGGGGDDSDIASRDEASVSDSEAGDTTRCKYALPLGRLCVSRDTGGDGVVITPYIVVMDLDTAERALWLVKDSYSPIGLPNDKETLLDFGGRYNFAIGKLADNVEEWDVRRISGPRGGHSSTQLPTLSWKVVEKLIQQSSEDILVLFDRVESRQEAAAAIEEGWNGSKPLHLSDDSGVEDSVMEDFDDDADGDYDCIHVANK